MRDPVFKNNNNWAGEMARWLRAFVALADDLGLGPNNLMMVHNHLRLYSQVI